MDNQQPNSLSYNRMGFIYCLTSPSGKKYIGQTIRKLEKRINEHRNNKLPGCKILKNAIKKYGFENFTVEVIMEINNQFLNYYEEKLIDLLDTKYPNGYNIMKGGSNINFSEETRNIMREKKLGERNHNFGKPKTEETRQKISEKKKGELHHFYNKELTHEHKLKLSKSHKKNDELPMYMVYLKPREQNYCSEGYAILNHPVLKNKYFTSKKLSKEEKYDLAYNYLNSIDKEKSSSTKQYSDSDNES